MRFWPFGKDDAEGAMAEYVSRVVTAKTADGATVRAKLNLVFVEPVPEARADATASAAAALLTAYFERGSADLLLGTEAEAASSVLGALPSSGHVRSVDVMAIHVVGASEPPRRARLPSSPGIGVQSRRSSSSQMLAVREARLVPPGATVEEAGAALQALLRDAATRALVGVLRAYDLTVVRGVGAAEEDLGDIVPQSTVAPGRFDLERRPEIARWEERLGVDVMGSLRDESATLVCAMLRAAVTEAGVGEELARGVLDAAAAAAFPEGRPLEDGRAYDDASGAHAELVAVRTLAILTLGKAAAGDGHASYGLAMVSLVASLRADLAFAAEQVKLGRLRMPSIAGE